MPVVPPAMLPCPKSILVQCRAVSLDGKNLERSPDLPLTETQTYQNLTRPPFDSQPFQFSSYSPRVLDRIPTEIWQRIFIFSLSSEQVPVLEEIFGPIWGRVCPPSSSSRASLLPSMPSTLSQVCWRWRDVAFGMPELWNILSLKAPRTNTDIDGTRKLRTVGHLIKSRLARSAPLPLKICIIAKDDVEGSRSLIRAFLPFSYQWETLHLQTPFKALSELGRLRPEDVPILRSVRMYEQAYAPGISSPETSGPFMEFDRFHLCNISPCLRRLCTSSLPLPPFSTSFSSHLHELNIQQSPSETCSTLLFLASCPQLRVLSLSGYGVTMNVPMPHYPEVVLPELNTLNLEHPTGRELLLERLVLPSLKSLWLGGRCIGETAQRLLQEIKDLMQRSGVGSLECLSLELETHSLESHVLVDFLAHNSLLKELQIDDSWKFLNRPLVTSQLLHSLTVPQGENGETDTDPVICPQMESIKFTRCSDFEDEDLLRFLRSRLKSPEDGQRNGSLTTRLAYADISIKRGLGKDVVEATRAWNGKGVEINVASA